MQIFALLLSLPMVAPSTFDNVSITFPQASGSQSFPPPQSLSPHIDPDSGPYKEVVHYIANLGLNTLKDLFAGPDNVVFSPVNVYFCLGLLALGAVEDTREELRRVLGPHDENCTVRETVAATGGVASASAVFLDNRFVAKSSFVDSARAEFGASILSLNMSNGEEAKRSINSWVAEHTNRTINGLLQGQLDPNTKMVIVNALLFKGKWLHSFPTAATALGKFKTDGGQVDVPLMHLLASVPLVRSSYFDAVSLPYIDVRGMTMHVLLPRAHGVTALKNLLSHLDANSLRKIRKEAAVEEIFVVMPKLNIEGRFSLTNTLKKQGIAAMFHPSRADFTAVAENSPGLFVSQIYHSLHFEVDEEGTAASAATASILTKSSRFIFRANRPFVFVVTDESDLVLFMGTVVDPSL